MRINKILKSYFVIVALLLSSQSHGVSISLSPIANTVDLPDQIVIDINMDFASDPTLGGGFDVFFDPALVSFVSYVLDPTLGSDPDFSRDPDPLTGKLEGIAFGNFNGISGPSRVGTLTFDTIAAGTASFSAADTTDPLKGGEFISEETFQAQVVDYVGADVTVVPLPAGIWLFGSGIIGLVAAARRRGR